METKKILGLDLGTNSIGWALVDKEAKKIIGMGSRIIPMGTDKLDYEKGVGITKAADRRTARTIRKMGKRYKDRRNKLLFILTELGICPDQFQFRHKVRTDDGKLTNAYENGFPSAKNIQDLELLPIDKGSLQLDSIDFYRLKVKALSNPVDLKSFGKILYQFNQRRGYAGGNNEDDKKTKSENDDTPDEGVKKKSYEVITQKVEILKVEKSDRTFKVKGGKNKGDELSYYDVTVILNDEEKEGLTTLQNLKDKEGKEEELEIRIKQTKNGENIVFALPQKTNWRKQLEATEELLKTKEIFISELFLEDLKKNKWTKIRNRVILRNRYKQEFDAIWDEQSKHHAILNKCPDDVLNKIAWFIFPGNGKSKASNQTNLRNAALNGGLKYIIKEQIIYYQRPIRRNLELIRKCRFETEESVLPISHPLFQEFRCWDQINRMYITSKVGTYNEAKKKTVYKYYDRYLTIEQKNEIYSKLQIQKQVGFNDVAKIVGLKNDKTEYLNGLNVKAKLKGEDTSIAIKKALGNAFHKALEKNKDIIVKIWSALFNNTGNEYDEKSEKVSSISEVLKAVVDESEATTLALKIAQTINFPKKYANLSAKAVKSILPLMQPNPSEINDLIKEKFGKIKHTIETGELTDDIEPYMVDYIASNPDIIKTGGVMFAFAASLVYGKHTISNIKQSINNYHSISYNPDRNLRNPVVEQILNETMQVIKAIWKQYKLNPQEFEVRIELARDLKNSAAEREKIYKGQLNNEKTNNRIKQSLEELKISATDENILKYKLYEQQKFISPYSGEPLELSLFNEYDIDHIIPKTRLFDDSFSNKVLVEKFLNKEKSNRTAWEYMTQQTTRYKICSITGYLQIVNDNFFGRKKKYLLLEKIPTDFVERQKKDTQYVSIAVKNELAKIIDANNIKSSTGEITNFLRNKWGLKKLFMKLTEERFRQMELWDWNKELNKANNEWVKDYFDKENEKNIYEIKNWSKRYDHRHHSIDALIVALTDETHIKRLNDLNKELQDWLTKYKDEIKLDVQEGESIIEAFFNLEENRREEIQKGIESFRKIERPFTDLINQAKVHLETMIVSHKPKDNLSIQYSSKTNQRELKIRGALHEATFYGKHNGKDTKTVSISNLTAKDIAKITDTVLRAEIDTHRKKYESMKEAFTGEGLKNFNESRFQRKKPAELKPPVYKLKIYYNTKEVKESSLQQLYYNNDKLSVKTGDNYLFLIMEKKTAITDSKTNREDNTERVFDIISLYDAVQIAKDELKEGNENFRRKIYEYYLQKHKANKVLFALQQNELVYLPENIEDPVLTFKKEQFETWIAIKENRLRFSKRIYKVVKFTGNDCFFIPHNYANTISVAKDLTDSQKTELKKQYGDKKIPKQELNFEEFGSFGSSAKVEVNKNFIKELTLKKDYKGTSPLKIQDHCIKLKTDWIGNVQIYI